MCSVKRRLGSSLETGRSLLCLLFTFLLYYTVIFHTVATFCSFYSPFLSHVGSVYSSEEDEEENEMYEHDYDGALAKAGKRHLGKTRWTREEVHTHSKPLLYNTTLFDYVWTFPQGRSAHTNLRPFFSLLCGPNTFPDVGWCSSQ